MRNAHNTRHKHGQEHEHTVLQLKQEVAHLWWAGPEPLSGQSTQVTRLDRTSLSFLAFPVMKTSSAALARFAIALSTDVATPAPGFVAKPCCFYHRLHCCILLHCSLAQPEGSVKQRLSPDLPNASTFAGSPMPPMLQVSGQGSAR